LKPGSKSNCSTS